MPENKNSSSRTIPAEKAVSLWRQGSTAWNTFIENNPDVDIDFSGTHFSQYLRPGEMEISFANFKFPKGNVFFSNCVFEADRVSFAGADFPGDHLSFEHAKFNSREIDFQATTFAKTDVNFTETIFIGDTLLFDMADFGYSKIKFPRSEFKVTVISFSRASFIEGNINFEASDFWPTGTPPSTKDSYQRRLTFSKADFGKSNLSFRGCFFSDATISFENSRLDKGDIDLAGTIFENGTLNFEGARFREGNVLFDAAHFIQTKTSFKLAHFGHGLLSFELTRFDTKEIDLSGIRTNGSIVFYPQFVIEKKPSINFSDLLVDGQLILGPMDLDEPINLTSSKIANNLSFDDSSFKFPGQPALHYCLSYIKATDEPESTSLRKRFRALKKIAKDGEDHQREIEFFANEMRSGYGYSITGGLLYLYLLYDKISDYGRNIRNPTCYLARSFLAFWLIYWIAGAIFSSTGESIIKSSFILSLSYSIPFLTVSRAAAQESIETIFSTTNCPDLFYILPIAQGLLSTIFIFLIGLALRNRFRT